VMIHPLVPGTYFVFLTQNLSLGYATEAWKDELRLRRGAAVRVVLREGATETVSIRPVVLKTELP